LFLTMGDLDPIDPAELLQALDHAQAVLEQDGSRYSRLVAAYLASYTAGEARDPAEFLTALTNEPGRSILDRARTTRRNRLVREEAKAIAGGRPPSEVAHLIERAMLTPRSARMREAVELGGQIKHKAIWRIIVGQ
jgi:hypothetical protein